MNDETDFIIATIDDKKLWLTKSIKITYFQINIFSGLNWIGMRNYSLSEFIKKMNISYPINMYPNKKEHIMNIIEPIISSSSFNLKNFSLFVFEKELVGEWSNHIPTIVVVRNGKIIYEY